MSIALSLAMTSRKRKKNAVVKRARMIFLALLSSMLNQMDETMRISFLRDALSETDVYASCALEFNPHSQRGLYKYF